MRVLIVDDHAAVRAGMLRLLELQPGMRASAVATGPKAVLASRRDAFDVVVVDYQLGHGEDGLSVTRALRRVADPPRILVYSAYADAPMAMLAMVAGADGLISKGRIGRDLRQAIRDVADGRRRWPVVPDAVIASVAARLPASDRSLLRMWTAGVGDRAIARVHGLSEDELEERRGAILATLGGPPGRAKLPWDDGDWPLSYARSRRVRA